MNLCGSETEKNLYRTFAGESRARNKYSFYAEKADCDGYKWIAEVFRETADNEKAHAREAFERYLKKCKSVEDNLEDSINGETEESKKTYKEFEKVAREEGFIEIADFYKELQEVEESHAKRFEKVLKRVREDKVFKDGENALWKCMNCGYIHEGEEAPKCCPLCKFPRSYFKMICKKD